MSPLGKFLAYFLAALLTNILGQRTLPACLASHLYLDLNLFLGKKTHCFLPPPTLYVSSRISTGLIWLIDYEVVFDFFTVQTQFFVMRHISCTNAVRIVSWSCNFVFKVKEWRFFTHGWVGGFTKNCVSMTPDWAPLTPFVLAALKTGFPFFRYTWILSRPFSRLLFFNTARRL